MNAFNRVNLIKKVAVLLAVTSISSLISLPVLAQSSPRPTVFSEAPYNRQDGAKPKPHGKKHGKHPGKHEHGGPGHPGKHEHGGPGHPPGDRGPKHPPRPGAGQPPRDRSSQRPNRPDERRLDNRAPGDLEYRPNNNRQPGS